MRISILTIQIKNEAMNTTKISDNIIPRIRENILYRIENGKAVLLDAISGEPYILNETATKIWQYLDGKTELNKIIEQIVCDYQTDKKQIREEILQFLNELIEKELVEI